MPVSSLGEVGDTIRDVDQLDDLLSEPSPALIDAMAGLPGDLIVLGASGKMGPSLARMARRASDAAGSRRRVVGVARFADDAAMDRLQSWGVDPIRCDLLDPRAIEQLPEAPNVVYLAGTKFGTTGREAMTWAINAYLPGPVCLKYRESRIVALSSGNVYPLSPVSGGGSREDDAPAPRGEYAMSCLGRERVFEHFSRTLNIPAALIRLNYAAEPRYGVLVDIARKVKDGEPIDLTMGHFNTLWQGDANAMTLLALGRTSVPPTILNLTGPETLSVRAVAREFGNLLGREVSFRGEEAPEALLNDASRALAEFGPPSVDAGRLIRWIADWVGRDGPSLGKPTGFEVRDGRF